MNAKQDFPIADTVDAGVPHGRFGIRGAASGALSGLPFGANHLFGVAGDPTNAGNLT